MAAPRLDAIDRASARAGATLTLTGADFGAKNDASAVRFRLPVDGAAPVAGTIGRWEATTITATIPAFSSFNSGGPLDVTVHTDGGDSGRLTFVLEEDAAPSLGQASPARGLQGDTVTITGSHLGRPTATSTVLFATASGSVAATVQSWVPGTIVATVPALSTLGGRGQHPITVRTPWGDSAPVDFLVGELPHVTFVDPPSPAPGATLTVHGTAFGDQPAELGLVAVYDTSDPNARANVTHPAIAEWQDERIVAIVPGFRGLRTTGARDVVVTTEWGHSTPDELSRILIESRGSITCWTRVEPHARSADLEAGLALGLQAQVYDPLWLLGRQWHMLELRGEDAGSPIAVDVNGTVTPLARWQPAGGPAGHVPGGVPLEALVERERVIPPPLAPEQPFADLRLSAEAGLHLLRLIDGQLRDPRKSDDYRKRFLRDYPLAAPAADALDARSRRFLAVAAGRAPDGSRMYADFQVCLGPSPALPKKPPIDGNDRAGVLAAIRDWYAWCEGLFSEPEPDLDAWERARMEYSFSTGSGDLVLEAREHDGGHLDWYSFSRRSGASLGAPAAGREPAPFARTAIPTPVSFPGMPAARWWALEDGRVDFGAVAAAPNELLKLVLVEFATVFGGDWFRLPLADLPVGSLCEIDTVAVRDAFGDSIGLLPFGDGAGTDWRMFELAHEDGGADAGHAMLLLDALPATQESDPLEDVLLLRDELANLAWAVERSVESATGRALDRHEDEASRRPASEPPAQDARRRYLLQTTVPRNWIPLLPKQEVDAGGAVTLRLLARGAMRDPAGGAPIAPRGALLDPGAPLDLYDEEVPRAGVRVTRLWTLGRAADGSTHLWRGRRKGPGRGEGSSGLAFDTTRQTGD